MISFDGIDVTRYMTVDYLDLSVLDAYLPEPFDSALLSAVGVAAEIAAYVWETAGIDAAVKVLAREAAQLDAAFGTDWPERVPC